MFINHVSLESWKYSLYSSTPHHYNNLNFWALKCNPATLRLALVEPVSVVKLANARNCPPFASPCLKCTEGEKRAVRLETIGLFCDWFERPLAWDNHFNDLERLLLQQPSTAFVCSFVLTNKEQSKAWKGSSIQQLVGCWQACYNNGIKVLTLSTLQSVLSSLSLFGCLFVCWFKQASNQTKGGLLEKWCSWLQVERCGTACQHSDGLCRQLLCTWSACCSSITLL